MSSAPSRRVLTRVLCISCLLLNVCHGEDYVDMVKQAKKIVEVEYYEKWQHGGLKYPWNTDGSNRYLELVHGYKTATHSKMPASALLFKITNRFATLANCSIDDLQKSHPAMNAFKKVMYDVCATKKPKCDPFYPYRSPDGTCNNLEKPLQGSASRPQFRELSPAYQDGVSAPRVLGSDWKPLPSARTISVAIHRALSKDTPRDYTHSLMLMQWGQLLAHDLVITPLEEDSDESCCENPGRDECFPITIEQPDPYFNTTCMDFKRSRAVMSDQCLAGQREQENGLTSYIDASHVYGSSQKKQDSLRTFSKGKLKTERTNLLPRASNDSCILDSLSDDYCLNSGDKRTNEQPGLGTIHTVFVREHNRIATILATINLSWDDEKLFQETRKIISAQMQHITYSEYLPEVVGPLIMARYGLNPMPKGYCNVYNSSSDASAGNAFSAAALRYGHSIVPGAISAFNKSLAIQDSLPLQNCFFSPKFYLSGEGHTVDYNTRWLAFGTGFKADALLERSIIDLLFLDQEGHSLDLAALNIQRGRDHGIRPYVQWRKICHLYPILRWGTGRLGLIDHTPEMAAKLKNVYKNVQDIDLFTGGMTEIPMLGGQVGPTFACIFGKQFKRSKEGDRFYYENQNSITGFTYEQINEIKKTTLSKILCENMNIEEVQRSAFRHMTTKIPCSQIQGMDLHVWREKHNG